MADEVEIAKNVLDVLSEVHAVASVLQITPMFGTIFPLLGVALGLVEIFLPDKKHEEILLGFEKLSYQIDHVRDDIRELEKTIKWENVKLQYGDVASRITLGMNYCLEIGKAKQSDSKIRYQEKLKELCSNQEFTLALRELMDGIIGNGLFRSSILDEFYEKTKGHRPKISALASRLLQLVCGGLIVNSAYEATVRGKKGAEEMMKGYEKTISDINVKVRAVLDRCENNFREHMLSDINDILDKNGLSNQALVDQLYAVMHDKYDWQEHFCIVYDNLWGFDNHCIGGYRVNSLHRNGKCGIVFCRTAGEPPTFSHRYDEAHSIVNDAIVNCYNARECNDIIVGKLEARNIYSTGRAIIRRTANVRFAGNFTSRIVKMFGKDDHAILMLE